MRISKKLFLKLIEDYPFIEIYDEKGASSLIEVEESYYHSPTQIKIFFNIKKITETGEKKKCVNGSILCSLKSIKKTIKTLLLEGNSPELISKEYDIPVNSVRRIKAAMLREKKRRESEPSGWLVK